MADNTLAKNYTFNHPCILIFPKKLFVPEKYIPEGMTDPEVIAKIEPKYQADFLVPFSSPDFEDVRKFVGALMLEKWPTANLSAVDHVGQSIFKWPWKNGTEEANKAKAAKDAGKKKYELEFARDHLILHTTAQTQPYLGGFVNGGEIAQFEGDKLKAVKDQYFYFGVEVFPSVTFVARDGNAANKPAVNAYANSILSTGKGKRIAGGRPDFRETFAHYVGKVSQEAPSGSADPTKVPF